MGRSAQPAQGILDRQPAAAGKQARHLWREVGRAGQHLARRPGGDDLAPAQHHRPLGEGGAWYGARVLTGQGVAQRKVKVALASRTEAAIASGLQVGDVLIVSDGKAAKPGKSGKPADSSASSKKPSSGMPPPGGPM